MRRSNDAIGILLDSGFFVNCHYGDCPSPVIPLLFFCPHVYNGTVE